MFTSITKIKNLGVFSDFTPVPNLAPFERYNVFYGLNGSGKTTHTCRFLERSFDGSSEATRYAGEYCLSADRRSHLPTIHFAQQ